MSYEIAKVALEAAAWATASPHEWVWTPAQQIAMARYCLLADALIRKAASDLKEIVCTEEPDDGVVLLSNDAPTEYDPIAKCQAYKHDHFSPLGDALISLHEHLCSLLETAE